jgi:hypothetical protein
LRNSRRARCRGRCAAERELRSPIGRRTCSSSVAQAVSRVAWHSGRRSETAQVSSAFPQSTPVATYSRAIPLGRITLIHDPFAGAAASDQLHGNAQLGQSVRTRAVNAPSRFTARATGLASGATGSDRGRTRHDSGQHHHGQCQRNAQRHGGFYDQYRHDCQTDHAEGDITISGSVTANGGRSSTGTSASYATLDRRERKRRECP